LTSEQSYTLQLPVEEFLRTSHTTCQYLDEPVQSKDAHKP